MTTPSVLAVALQLGDGRFPAGGHAHSNGAEAACTACGVDDVGSLRTYVEGRLATSGTVDAAFAASACHTWTEGGGWAALDAELTARTASAALRRASRVQGRQLVRAGERMLPGVDLRPVRASHPDGPHQAVALGAVAGAVGLGPREAAALALHHLVAAWTSAAVRLHGLDPFAVAALQLDITGHLDAMAERAAALASASPRDLPAATGLLLDVLAEHHAGWDTRMFAS